jgi:hypothetical protein
MRRGFLLVAVCMGAGVAGCGDDDDGVIDRPDANIFADGSTIDANHDPDAHPLFGPITVRVYDQDGLLRPGTDVVVNRFEQVEFNATTGADGTAHPMVNSGDSVTVLYEFQAKGTVRQVMTWNGVEPGDVLTMGSPAPDATSMGQMTVTTPGPFEGAASYRVSSGCEVGALATPGPFTYPLVASCHPDPAHVPVFLQALAPDGHALAYASRGDAMVVDMAASASFDAWRTDPVAFSGTITHLPAPAPTLTRHLALLAQGGELFGLPLTVSGDGASAQVPQGLAPSWIFAQDLVDEGGLTGRWSVVAGAAPIPASLALDASSGLLARIENLMLDATFPERTQAFWSLDASSGSTLNDALVVSFELAEDGARGTWTVVVSGGSTLARLPALPDTLAAFRPLHPARSVTVVALESNNADYAQLRRVLTGTARDGASLWPVVTSPLRAGTARMSERLLSVP